nr:hypothetical protein [Tanacetum cinerariifolium]
MSSITAQQAKLDLELVPKEKRLEIGNATEDSILERSKKNPHFKSFLMLLLSLHATLHFSSLQMFQKFSTKAPTTKSKRVKRPAKKSTDTPARDVVIRETPEMSLSKKKEKMTVKKHKGIDMLSKWVWYRYQTAPSIAKIKPSTTSEGIDDRNNEQVSSDEDSDQEKDSEDDKTQLDNELESDSEHETNESESSLESNHDESEENEEDDEDETKITDKAEGDEDEEMDYTTSQLYDDVDIKDIPHTYAEIVSPLDVHVHNEVPSQQTPTLLTVPVSVIFDSSPIFSIVILQSLPSFTLPPQQSSPTPPPTTKATNPQTVHPNFAFVFEFNNRVTTLEKEVVELKKDDPLKTQVTALVDEHLDARLGATRDEFMNFLSALITARITEKVKNQLPQILSKEVSNISPPSSSSKGDKSKSKSYGKSVQSEELEFEVAESDMPHDQEENPDNDDEPKEKVAFKRDWFTKPTQPQEPIDPDWNIGKTPQQGQNQSWLMTLASSTEKPSKNFDELMSTLIEFTAFIVNGLNINNLTQETLLGLAFRLLKGTRSNFAELECDFQECYKALSETLNWENPEGGAYPFDLTKPLPLVKIGNRQKVPVDYFFNNDLKYLQGGISTMAYTTFLTKTKAAQYDLPGIEDMRILAVTPIEVMRKHGYGYLQEIVVRKADNDLYRFKEDDFPRLHVNDIEDMLLLVVQNRLKNLSGDDVLDFAIALRMFTRSLVIQKRVEDLQLGVESYQKKINVIKPETTKSRIRKRYTYTPYLDPQGFIYVDDSERNRLMRSDELYKFNDGTLTRLRTSLGDITKNIRMEYLPKRRWSMLAVKLVKCWSLNVLEPCISLGI